MYQPSYTKEEVEELLQWFDTNTYDNEINIGSGQHVNDVKKCVNMLRHTALSRHNSTTFSGPISVLFTIREQLIEQGKVH